MVVVEKFKTNEEEWNNWFVVEQEEGGESSSCVSCWKEVDLEEIWRKPVKPVKPLKKFVLIRFSRILLMW